MTMTAYENYLIGQSIQLSGPLTQESRIAHAGNVAAMIYFACVEDANPLAISIIGNNYSEQPHKSYFDAGMQIVEKHILLTFNKN